MLPRPPGSTRTYPLFPVTTLFRSGSDRPRSRHGVAERADRAELQDATGFGGTFARWRHRGQLRQRTRSPAPPARARGHVRLASVRSEEHTSELQSLMRISYAVFCLKKKMIKQFM